MSHHVALTLVKSGWGALLNTSSKFSGVNQFWNILIDFPLKCINSKHKLKPQIAKQQICTEIKSQEPFFLLLSKCWWFYYVLAGFLFGS